MPEYVIRVLRSVEIFEKVEEVIVEAGSLGEAKDKAFDKVAEKYAQDFNIITDVKEKEKEKDPFSS
jgi:hypothetical protein